MMWRMFYIIKRLFHGPLDNEPLKMWFMAGTVRLSGTSTLASPANSLQHLPLIDQSAFAA